MADITYVTISNTDITQIYGVEATLTLPGSSPYSFSDQNPRDIQRTADSGVLNIMSRADHAHSVANTLLDGGNY
jgi:hypothetical protein